MSNESDDVKRWKARRKATAVMDILKGKTTASESARSHDLTVAEVEQWLEDFFSRGTEALRLLPATRRPDTKRRSTGAKNEIANPAPAIRLILAFVVASRSLRFYQAHSKPSNSDAAGAVAAGFNVFWFGLRRIKPLQGRQRGRCLT
jgi:transposase-like protein